jgi:hypothetical protein
LNGEALTNSIEKEKQQVSKKKKLYLAGNKRSLKESPVPGH